MIKSYIDFYICIYYVLNKKITEFIFPFISPKLQTIIKEIKTLAVFIINYLYFIC